ncbi:MAG: alkaline phosphatase family protein [Bacteroidetes bacterium]|nr:alkaline phosphatase family protein [Bacteroidota bacterium]
MRKLYLLLLLLSSTATLFAQNKLPQSPNYTLHARFSSMISDIRKCMCQHYDHLFDSKTLASDSIFEKWRTHELVQDEEHPSKYLIIITLDGMRWQEVFTGASDSIWQQGITTTNTPAKDRESLMPFLWKTVAAQGQIYGNRIKGSRVNVTNKMHISYPGYNEIFTGHPDDRHIKLNFKIPNPNQNVLAHIGKNKNFLGRVASFASWDVFPSIFNQKRGGMYINAAFEKVPDAAFVGLNAQLKTVQRRWGSRVRPDSLTAAFALEYLEQRTPRVLHIGLGETDEYAHEKNYPAYLQAARSNDAVIARIWQFVQSSPVYRNKTTLFITTDHGRGNTSDTWHKHHGWAKGSDEIWFAVMGPETMPLGEMEGGAPCFQNQFARTFAGFLGLEYGAEEPVGEKIATLFGVGAKGITQR